MPSISVLFNLLLALVDLYAGGVIVYLLLRLLTQERLWPIMLVNNVAHWMLVPALIFVPVLKALRHWRRAALNGVGVIAFVVLFGNCSCRGCHRMLSVPPVKLIARSFA
jgi:hypothetical protein